MPGLRFLLLAALVEDGRDAATATVVGPVELESIVEFDKIVLPSPPAVSHEPESSQLPWLSISVVLE